MLKFEAFNRPLCREPVSVVTRKMHFYLHIKLL